MCTAACACGDFSRISSEGAGQHVHLLVLRCTSLCPHLGHVCLSARWLFFWHRTCEFLQFIFACMIVSSRFRVFHKHIFPHTLLLSALVLPVMTFPALVLPVMNFLLLSALVLPVMTFPALVLPVMNFLLLSALVLPVMTFPALVLPIMHTRATDVPLSLSPHHQKLLMFHSHSHLISKSY
jgi:hypothetical protein